LEGCQKVLGERGKHLPPVGGADNSLFGGLRTFELLRIESLHAMRSVVSPVLLRLLPVAIATTRAPADCPPIGRHAHAPTAIIHR